MTVHPGHVATRCLVILPDGRTGHLTYVPGENKRGGKGRKARVRLPSGAFASVPPADLTLHPDSQRVHLCETCGEHRGPFCRRPDGTWLCRGCCPHTHGRVTW